MISFRPTIRCHGNQGGCYGNHILVNEPNKVFEYHMVLSHLLNNGNLEKRSDVHADAVQEIFSSLKTNDVFVTVIKS